MHPDPADRLLASHLSGLLRVGAPEDGPPVETPAGAEVDAAVVFADLVGYTALSESLTLGIDEATEADRPGGPRGPDRIAAVLDLHLGALIDAVHATGGDVVKFAGDAVLATWLAGDGGLPAAAAAALRCGLRMQAALAALPAVPGVPALRLRVGVGAGPICVTHLGDAEVRRELLVNGPAVDATTEAASDADPGEVRAAPGVRALVGEELLLGPDGASVQALGRGLIAAPLPERRPVPWDPRYAAYLPASVVRRIQAGLGAWLPELRRVSIVFARLPGLRAGADPADLDRLFRASQRAVHAHGGVTNKLNVDEKGATLLAVFGLPPDVHEDDAARACCAGIALAGLLAEGPAGAGVGVATGRAFCGEVGADARREFTVIGDPVNTAARLMIAAGQGGEGLLCDALTARRCGGSVDLVALPPRALKGKRAPVAVFTVRGPGGAREPAPTAPPARLVGRELPQARLAEAGRRLQVGGDAGVLLVVGPAGLGKSALVRAAADAWTAAGLRVAVGGGERLGAGGTAQPWGRILGALYPGASPDSLLRAAGADAPLLPLIADLLPAAGLGPVPAVDPAARPAARLRLIQRLVAAAAAARPTVVVVEDAHCVDAFTLDCALALIAARAPLLVVITSRPPPDAPEHLWRKLQALPTPLPLGPLVRAEVDELLTVALGVPELPASLGELVWERTRGNPLFVLSLIDHLRDRGALEVAGGRCRLREDRLEQHRAELPATVEAMLLTRLDQLSPECQISVKVAAVLGPRFAVGELVALHPIHPEPAAVDANLAEMARMRVAQPDPAGEPGVWAFRHVLLRDAVYEILPEAQRRSIHGAAAAHLRGQGGPTVPWERVAAHLEAAGEPGAAVEALCSAATQAARAAQPGEVLELLERVDRLLERSGLPMPAAGRQPREEALASAFATLGDLRRARAHQREVLAGLPGASWTDALPGAGWLALRRARRGGGGPEAAPRAQALLRLAWIEHASGDARAAARRARSAAGLGRGPLIPRALALLARLEVHEKRPSAARARLADLSDTLPPAGDWASEVGAATVRLSLAADAAELGRCLGELRGLLQRPEGRADGVLRERLLANLGLVHLLRGEPHRVLEDLHDRSAAPAPWSGREGLHPPAWLPSLRTLALAACAATWELGDLSWIAAASAVDHGPDHRLVTQAALARAAWHQGRRESALQHAEEALAAVAAGASRSPELLAPSALLVEVLVGLAELPEGPPGRAAALDTGMAWLGDLGGAMPLARAWWLRLEARRAQGQPLRGAWLARAAAGALERLGLPPLSPGAPALPPPMERPALLGARWSWSP